MRLHCGGTLTIAGTLMQELVQVVQLVADAVWVYTQNDLVVHTTPDQQAMAWHGSDKRAAERMHADSVTAKFGGCVTCSGAQQACVLSIIDMMVQLAALDREC